MYARLANHKPLRYIGLRCSKLMSDELSCMSLLLARNTCVKIYITAIHVHVYPPSASSEKNGPCLNAGAYDYRRNCEGSCMLFFKILLVTSTKIRSFKYGPFFFRLGRGGGGGGGGDISRYSTAHRTAAD